MPSTARLSLIAAAALLAAGAAATPAPAAPLTPITIGLTVWVGYGPMFLARDLGYFKDAGVDVNLQVVDDNALAMAAEAAGRMDGSASTIDEVLKYAGPHDCFKAVSVLDDSYGGDGAVATDDIKTLADIKGKTVAMNEGSTSQFWWAYVLKKQGIPLNSFTLSNMSADDAAAAFIAGHVPVAVTWEPNLTMVRTKGVGHVLIDSRSIPGVIIDVLQLSCKTIKDHPQAVQGIVDGIFKAVDYAKAHPAEADAIMAKGVGGYLSKPSDFADAEKGVRFYTQQMAAAYVGTMQAPGKIDDVITTGNEIWHDLGRMKETVPYAAVVDPSFIDAAK
jgi:NitT/TauT family transport system substrate-binding protein